ncbi:MAG: hypothetical protein JSS78_03000 [Bacteroidetes bacterium]|nr:hypothetical protein [Bacteroidota bacterium]
MKRIILSVLFLTSAGMVAKAQTSAANASAQQTVQLQLSNVLDITFVGNSSSIGSTVALPFTTANDYANGVESSAQQLRIRSNKNFNVTVRANAANFTVTNGSSESISNMPANVLNVKVSSNQTGGSIAGSFSNYTGLSNTANNLISNGTFGGNQTFSVMYKATPGFAYPAGTYSLDVVYTATQQ